MSRSIVVGDIHGCFYTLEALLEKIGFVPHEDHLYVLGDMIGKGLHSARVLTYLQSLPFCEVVLGNHDISWLRACATQQNDRSDFQTLLDDPAKDAWFEWLIAQPFALVKDFGVLVHASVEPSWLDVDIAKISQWLSNDLQKDPAYFFKAMKKPALLQWHAQLSEEERRYLAVQILTRCRFYTHRHILDLTCTDTPSHRQDLIPWYELDRACSQTVWFGHWASLKDRPESGVIHLDGGAVYGGKLLAMDVHLMQRFEQKRVDKDA